MPMDAQVGWHDPTAHVQGFSCLKGEADNHDIIRWCHCHYTYIKGWELYKGSVQEPQELLSGFLVAVHFVAIG